MRARHDLPKLTWQQAAIAGLWPASAFHAVGILPATIRQWAHRGHIEQIARGPRGVVLYRYTDVIGTAERHVSH